MFQFILIITTFLCSIVSGILFAFSVVVMPGIRQLQDRDFIKAFQAMDKIIQNKQPVFMVFWIGSILSFIASVVLSFSELNTADFLILLFACILFFAGVQLPTITIHIPLNNKIQALNVAGIGDAELKKIRQEFENRWNKWNNIRSVFSCLTSVLLILLLYMISK